MKIHPKHFRVPEDKKVDLRDRPTMIDPFYTSKPVEVLEFGWRSQVRFLESLGAVATLRMQGAEPYRTDGGNLILDNRFGAIANAAALAGKVASRAVSSRTACSWILPMR